MLVTVPGKRIHFILPDCREARQVSLVGTAIPIGPTALYSFAKGMGFGRFKDARCVDLDIHEEKGALEGIHTGDLACVTLTLSNYKSALRVIKKAKEAGATTAVGGPWAGAKARQIMDRHATDIDYLVQGEGETGLGKIIGNRYLPHGIVDSAPIRMDELPAPDFSGWSKEDIKTYFDNYRRMIRSGKYGPAPDEIPLFVFYQSSRGCIQMPRCGFCGSRLGNELKYRSPDRFAQDMKKIKEQLSWLCRRIHIFDCSDSFTSSLNRFGGVGIEHDPDVTFTVYARADEISAESAAFLRSLGVTKTSIGVETGSDRTMITIGKRSSIEKNLAAIRFLADAGIMTYVNLLYGIPGETRDDLHRTLEHFGRIADAANGMIYRVAGRIVTPLPNARWYTDFLRKLEESQPSVAEEIRVDDHINIDMIQKLWLSTMTNVSYDDIQRVHTEIAAIAKKNGATLSSEVARGIV